MVAIGAAVIALGFGASLQARDLAAKVTGNPGQYFNADAYPPDALRAGEEGRVVAQLRIDGTGRVISCTVKVSSGSVSLDATTCRIALDKVSFMPATDRRGRPIASSYTLPVRWVLPVDPGFAILKPYAIVTETAVDRNGVARSCTRRDNGVERQESDACAGFRPPVAAVVATLPAALRGRPLILLAESRLEIDGAAPPTPLDADLTVLFRIVEHFTVGTDGRATDCRIDPSSTVATPNPDPPCASGKSFRDQNGKMPSAPLQVTQSALAGVRPAPEGGGI